MKKRLLVFSTLVFASNGLFGQQDAALTHFIFNKQAVNPAAAAIDGDVCATMLYRNQWDRVSGAPNSLLFNAEAPVPFIGTSSGQFGAGISYVHDAIGFNRQHNVLLNFNYQHILPTGWGILSTGLGLGMVNFSLSPNWVPPSLIMDPTLPGNSSATGLDMNFGLFWKKPGVFYVGLSSTHINAPTLTVQSALSAGAGVGYNSVRHMFMMAGYQTPSNSMPLSGHLDFQGMARTDMVKYSFDLNVRYMMFGGNIYAGLTYRTSDAAALMAGMTVLNAKAPYGAPGGMHRMIAGYSYDLTVNKLSTVSQGTHELLLKYCYILPPPPVEKSKHPRYL